MQDKSPFQVYPNAHFKWTLSSVGSHNPSWTDSHTRCAGCKYLQTWSIIYPYFNQRMNPFSFHKTEDMHTNKISFIFKVWPKGVWLQLGTKVTPPTVPQKPMHTPGTCSSTLKHDSDDDLFNPFLRNPLPHLSRHHGNKGGPKPSSVAKFTSSSCHWRTFSGRDEACETDTPPADGQHTLRPEERVFDVEVKKGGRRAPGSPSPRRAIRCSATPLTTWPSLSRRRSTPISDETASILCTPPPSRCERWDVYVCVRVYVCMVVRNVP